MAHPRSRGENVTGTLVPGVQSGSSPLTRGKRAPRRGGNGARGLIPAHAGKTFSRLRWALWRRAHPRSRGENVRLELTRPALRGSSPLTRGKPTRSPTTLKKRGLIPAHAGKTRRSRPCSVPHWAHPRSRGENRPVGGTRSTRSGSSPLTRGKPARRRRSSPAAGLIPAHAGKTILVHAPASHSAAHPRSRGENKEETHDDSDA